MPCNTVQKSAVEFSAQSTDTKLLARALVQMGFNVVEQENGTLQFSRVGASGTFANGKLEITARSSIEMNQFKRAYSAEVVKSEAARFGWKMQQTESNKFELLRRY